MKKEYIKPNFSIYAVTGKYCLLAGSEVTPPGTTDPTDQEQLSKGTGNMWGWQDEGED